MKGRREFLAAAAGLLAMREARAQSTPGLRKDGAGGPAPDASRTAELEERIRRVLTPVRDQHHLPGLVGALVHGDAPALVGAVGLRKIGASEPFRPGDRVHLGSCTKAMTATVVASVVEEGKLTWDSTTSKVFPELARAVHPDFRPATLWDFLTHRAGLPHDGPWWQLGRGKTTTQQRRVLLTRMLSQAPLSRPGTKYEYSNVGYALAGLMAEHVTGRSWEDLMRRRLFEPLGMTTAGFGVPGVGTKVDEPWGHRGAPGDVRPVRADNAPALGPAGTVHASISDWAKFAALHVQAARGKPRLLQAATFRKLQTPSKGSDYAGGWYIGERSWAGGTTLMHKGSNTSWYCSVWLAPARDLAVLVASNQGDGPVDAACDEATEALLRLETGSRQAAARRRRR
ncbi:MAG: serine hydrolase domain-containing protein [Isosphaeraceae bacterium]